MNASNNYKLIAEEFWFLLQNFSPAVLLGITNPYLGLLIEEINASQQQAVANLLSQGFIRTISDNKIDIDDNLFLMVETCAHPEHTVIFQFQDEKGGDFQRYFHFKNKIIVEHYEIEPGYYFLSLYNDRQILLSKIFNQLNITSEITNKGDIFCLERNLLFQSRSHYQQDDTNEALKCLKDSGLSDTEINILAKALSNPEANAAFVTISNRNTNTQFIKGFAVLRGQDDLWVLLPKEKNGKEMVEFCPANKEVIEQHFVDVIP